MRIRPLVTSLLVGVAVAIPTSAAAISGGEKANSEYIVQIATNTKNESKKIDRCTGSALNSEWVITAVHCVEDAASQTSSNIYFSNNKSEPGTPIASSQIVHGPSADLALIKLSRPHELSQYATLASDHEFTLGQKGHIYGYGRGSNGEQVSWLRRAAVTQKEEGRDAYWNKTYEIKGIDGISNHGDSGGPFIVNGKLVGITVSGPHVANDYWVGEVSNAVVLAPFIEWITETTGVEAVPFDTEIPEPESEKGDEKDEDASATQPETDPIEDPKADPTKQPETDSATDPDNEASEESEADSAANLVPGAEDSVVDDNETSNGVTDNGVTGDASTSTETTSTEGGNSSAAETDNQAVGTPQATVPGTGQATAQEKRQSKLAHTGAFATPLAVAGLLSLGAGALLVLRGSASRREA